MSPALLTAWAVVFLMNVVPLHLPPAWTVLGVFYATAGVPLLPLTVGGSAAAALGRLGFSRIVGRMGARLPADLRANAEALAAAAHTRLRWPAAFVALYSFLPLSSDPVFVAVGLGALPLRSSLAAFFVARSVFNTLVVWGSQPVATNLGDVFAGTGGWRAVAVPLAAAAGYVVFLKLPWARWLGLPAPAAPAAPDTTPSSAPQPARLAAGWPAERAQPVADPGARARGRAAHPGRPARSGAGAGRRREADGS
jgi:membrane protein YqaA with SNARE-associated domain